MSLKSALNDLEPIERNTLGGKVYDDLRSLIMSGRLAPGDKLSLRSVAEALGVSVMPVRDAVGRLVAEQALAVTPNRSVSVPVMTAADFRELATIRAEIEGFAAEQAAINRSSDDVREIQAAEAAYRAECAASTPDHATAMRLNMDLHFAIYRASKLPSLVEIIESLWLRAGPVITLDSRDNAERLASGAAHKFHRQALRAVRDRDPAGARAGIAGDIGQAAEFLLSHGAFVDGTIPPAAQRPHPPAQPAKRGSSTPRKPEP